MKNIKCITVCCLTISSLLLSSCASLTFKQANLFYQNKEYAKAINKYESLTERQKEKFEVYKELAASYFNTYNYEQAQQWYKKAIKIDNVESILYYQLALALKMNNNCAEGKSYLEKYNSLEREQNRGVFINADFCNQTVEVSDLYALEKITFSNRNNLLNPTMYNGRLYFLSKIDNNDNYNICSINDSLMNDFKLLKSNFTEDYLVGPFSFDNTDSTLYFTRLIKGVGKYIFEKKHEAILEIVRAKFEESEWKIEGAFVHNSLSHSVAQPAITPDGKYMVFVSDKKGTAGETDLYVCEKVANGSWGEVTQLPANINTEHKELTPTFSFNSTKSKYILSYASDKPNANVGFDVYGVEFDGKNWGEVFTFDYPINTSSNEYSLFYDQKNNEALITSDRGGENISDEMFKFSVSNGVHGVLRDEQLRPLRLQQLKITNIKTGESQYSETNYKGEYQAKISQGNAYKVTFESYKYEAQLMELNSDKNIVPIIYELDLKAIVKTNNPDQITMTEVHFSLNSARIEEQNSTDLLKLYNTLQSEEDVSIIITGYTDSRGSNYYNYLLSRERAESVVKWLVNKGIEIQRLTFAGKGEEDLVNRCKDGVACSAEEHQQNRRITFSVN